MKTKQWIKKRQEIKKRDGKCRICESYDNLEVHHTKYEKGFKAWEYDKEFLITLCKYHHKWVHEHDEKDKFIINECLQQGVYKEWRAKYLVEYIERE